MPTLIVGVVQADGRTPASFASLTVSRRVCFWVFCWPEYVASATADFYGHARFRLEAGKRYWIRVRWRGRVKEEPIIMPAHDYLMTITLPR